MSTPPTPAPAAPAAHGAPPGRPHGFLESVQDGLRLAFRWGGRASRAQLWWFLLASYVLTGALVLTIAAVMTLLLPSSSQAGAQPSTAATVAAGALGLTFGLACLYLTIAYLGVVVRRLHDLGLSGALALLLLVPVLGPVMVIVWGVQEGQPFENRYGPRPVPRR